MTFFQNIKSSNTFSYKSNAQRATNEASSRNSDKKQTPTTKFAPPRTKLKDLMPGKWYTPNAMCRAQYHIDKFVHRDKIVKYAAAVGIGGAVVTGVLMGVGVIKVAAIGAFFASPVGHGVLIGAGAAVGAYLLFRLGKFAYNKAKERSAQRMAQVVSAKEENFNKGFADVSATSSNASPVPQYRSTTSSNGRVSPNGFGGSEGWNANSNHGVSLI